MHRASRRPVPRPAPRSVSRAFPRALVVVVLTLFTGFASASREVDVAHRGVVIAPGETWSAMFETDRTFELVWSLVDGAGCERTCVEVAYLDPDDDGPTVLDPGFGDGRMNPGNGDPEPLTLVLRNVHDRPVVMDVVHEKLVCDSEACAVLAAEGIIYPYDHAQVDFEWVRVVLDEAPRIDTSDDGSWSLISGRTVYGTDVAFTVIWWLVDEDSPGCRDHLADADPYDPDAGTAYQFNGSFVVPADALIMAEVLGCSRTDVEERGENDL